MSMWTLRSARRFIGEIQPDLNTSGWYAALAGGVLNNKKSDHDLDLVLVPWSSQHQTVESIRRVLSSHGWYQWADCAQVQRHWRKKGSDDYKHVEVWKDDRDRRVDIIIPSRTTGPRP